MFPLKSCCMNKRLYRKSIEYELNNSIWVNHRKLTGKQDRKGRMCPMLAVRAVSITVKVIFCPACMVGKKLDPDVCKVAAIVRFLSRLALILIIISMFRMRRMTQTKSRPAELLPLMLNGQSWSNRSCTQFHLSFLLFERRNFRKTCANKT